MVNLSGISFVIFFVVNALNFTLAFFLPIDYCGSFNLTEFEQRFTAENTSSAGRIYELLTGFFKTAIGFQYIDCLPFPISLFLLFLINTVNAYFTFAILRYIRGFIPTLSS